MREIYTVIRKHGSTRWETVLDSSHSVREHRAFIKRLRLAKRDPYVAEVRMCVPIRRVHVERAPIAQNGHDATELPQPVTVAKAKVEKAVKPKAKAKAKASTGKSIFGLRLTG